MGRDSLRAKLTDWGAGEVGLTSSGCPASHSQRNETTGSTAAARRAGSHAESSVTAVMPAVAAMKIVGSKGLIR